MASTDQVITKIQLMKKAKLPTLGSGRWKPARLLQCIELGLKNGRKMRAVRGTIETTPSRVAKPAPSRIPSQEGMLTTARMTNATTRTATEIFVPRVPNGVNSRPIGTPNRLTM